MFMPADAPRVKVDSTRRWGAEIVRYDRVRDDREAMAAAYAARTGATLIPPFDHPHVIAGQGTLALELAEDAGAAGLALDALLVCTGGGGMIAGCALALEGVSPATQVYAVEPEGADDTVRSLKSGQREANPPGGSHALRRPALHHPGGADLRHQPAAAGRRRRGQRRRGAGGDRFAFTHLKLVVEPGGAVCLAAILAGKFDAQGPRGGRRC